MTRNFEEMNMIHLGFGVFFTIRKSYIVLALGSSLPCNAGSYFPGALGNGSVAPKGYSQVNISFTDKIAQESLWAHRKSLRFTP